MAFGVVLRNESERALSMARHDTHTHTQTEQNRAEREREWAKENKIIPLNNPFSFETPMPNENMNTKNLKKNLHWSNLKSPETKVFAGTLEYTLKVHETYYIHI